jgi:hypothetical protein
VKAGEHTNALQKSNQLMAYLLVLIDKIQFDRNMSKNHFEVISMLVSWMVYQKFDVNNNDNNNLSEEELEDIIHQRRLFIISQNPTNWRDNILNALFQSPHRQEMQRHRKQEAKFLQQAEQDRKREEKENRDWLDIEPVENLGRVSRVIRWIGSFFRRGGGGQNQNQNPDDDENVIYGLQQMMAPKATKWIKRFYLDYLKFPSYESISLNESLHIPQPVGDLILKLKSSSLLTSEQIYQTNLQWPEVDDSYPEQTDWNEPEDVKMEMTRYTTFEIYSSQYLDPKPLVMKLLGDTFYGKKQYDPDLKLEKYSTAFFPESELASAQRIQDVQQLKLMLETWILNKMNLRDPWRQMAINMQVMQELSSSSSVTSITNGMTAEQVSQLPPLREWPSNNDIKSGSSQEEKDRAAIFGPFNGQYQVPDIRSAWVQLNAETQACKGSAVGQHFYPAFRPVPGGFLKPMCGRDGWMADEALKVPNSVIRAVVQRDVSDKEMIYWIQQTLEGWCPESIHVVRVWFWLGLSCLSKEVLADFTSGILQMQRSKDRHQLAQVLKQQTEEIDSRLQSGLQNNNNNILGSQEVKQDENRSMCLRRILFLYQALPSLMIFPFVPNESKAFKMAAEMPGLVLTMLDWSHPGRIKCVQMSPLDSSTQMKSVMIDQFYTDPMQNPVSALRLWVFDNFAGGVLAATNFERQKDFSRRSARILPCRWKQDNAGFYSIRFLLPWSEQSWFDQTLRQYLSSNGQDEVAKSTMMRFWDQTVSKQVEGFTESQQIVLRSLIELEHKRWIVPTYTSNKTIERLKKPQEVFQKGRQLFQWQGTATTKESIQTMIDLSLCQNPKSSPEVIAYLRQRVSELQLHPDPNSLTRSDLCSLLIQSDTHKIVEVDVIPPMWWEIQPIPLSLSKPWTSLQVNNNNNIQKLILLDIFTTDALKRQEIEQFLLNKFGLKLEKVQQANLVWSEKSDMQLLHDLEPYVKMIEMQNQKQMNDEKIVQDTIQKMRPAFKLWMETADTDKDKIDFGLMDETSQAAPLNGMSYMFQIMLAQIKQMWHPLAKLSAVEHRFMDDINLLLKQSTQWMNLSTSATSLNQNQNQNPIMMKQNRLMLLRSLKEFCQMYGDPSALTWNLVDLLKNDNVLRFMAYLFFTKFGDPSYIPDWTRISNTIRKNPKLITVTVLLLWLHYLLRYHIVQYSMSSQKIIQRAAVKWSAASGASSSSSSSSGTVLR